METVVLIIHLIIALAIIALVLMQRSTGGGLGIGGGGGMGDFASARGAANALTKLTTYFAFAFFCTSLILAYLAGQGSSSSSVLDALDEDQVTPAVEVPVEPSVPEPEVPTPGE